MGFPPVHEAHAQHGRRLGGRRLLLFCALAWPIGGQRIDYAEAGAPYAPEEPTVTRPAEPAPQPAARTAAPVTQQPATAAAPAAPTPPLPSPTGAPLAASAQAPPAAAAVAVVAPPTTTVTHTTTPLTLIPSAPDAVLQPGLVGELFDFKTKQTTVAVIDKTVHHWGDVYSALAMKWRGLLNIRSYGQYRFQIICMGAAELRIDGTVIINENAVTSEKTIFSSEPVMIAAGYHDILIGYTELEGQAGFAINYLGPDTAGVLKLIPPQAFLHKQGPCDLRDILAADSIACGSEDSPRWALASGESCQVRCSWGRYPDGSPGSPSVVTCQNGLLSPPNFHCAPRSCSIPKVPGAADRCAEGVLVSHGQKCTPTCLDGYEPAMSVPLQCSNGTMSGEFTCQPKRSCAAPDPKRIDNVGLPVCLYGTSVLHGARCGADCAPGYEPTVDPICKDGFLEPQVFSCRRSMSPPVTSRPTFAYQAASVHSTTPLNNGLLGSAPGPGGSAAGPLFALVAALLVAVASAAACCCMAYSGAAKKRQSRGIQLGDSRPDSRPRSMSTDYSGYSASDVEGRNHSDYSNSEDDSDDASPPPSPAMPHSHLPHAQASRHGGQDNQKLLEERRLAERRRLEEQQRQEQQRQAEAERRQAEERSRLEKLQSLQRKEEEMRAKLPTERILGTSVRPLPPSRQVQHAPGQRQHRYVEDTGSDWSDVRAGDHNPYKANHVPWSDVRLS